MKRKIHVVINPASGRPKPILHIEHWQARRIRIEVDPPQPVQVDGEMVDDTPISAEVLPGALKVIVPKSALGF